MMHGEHNNMLFTGADMLEPGTPSMNMNDETARNLIATVGGGMSPHESNPRGKFLNTN